MGLFSTIFGKEEREFIKQLGDKIHQEEVAHIRSNYGSDFGGKREYFDEFKKKVLEKIKSEH